MTKSIQPGTKVRVDIPKAQVSYMVKNSKYSHDQIVQLIQLILEDVLKDTKVALTRWINSKVPKRTGQLRKMLEIWMEGSSVGENIMKLILGTNLPYAEDVSKMTTSQVRHNNEWGYVYYPNIFGIDSETMPKGHKKIRLHDPRAIGNFWEKMLEFAKEEVDKSLIRAKNKHLGNAVKRSSAASPGGEIIMADDSELDYIRTFVGEAMTGYTIKQFSEVKNISLINDTQRGLIYPGEILTTNDVYYTSRYKLKISDATEAALTTGIKNLIIGQKKYNARQTGVTQVADMTHIRVVSGSKAYEHGSTKRWNIDMNLDIVWSVA